MFIGVWKLESLVMRVDTGGRISVEVLYAYYPTINNFVNQVSLIK